MILSARASYLKHFDVEDCRNVTTLYAKPRTGRGHDGIDFADFLGLARTHLELAEAEQAQGFAGCSAGI